MDSKWEFFSVRDIGVTAGQVLELLEQTENQGYDPRFMTVGSGGVVVYGRKKDLPQLSSQSELPFEYGR